mmetsp:Transcript_34829/g.74219  ORF Transcript_34829/g.74219 Transcript_34829/m.74219 type:complete len:389 (+) Transcript_34829:165-1331(+)|eukprot:CAMPEP_0172548130 /NCGR_PEP_ID=MMETSP1067-20121228/17508_1 /TAXON_ID=265564 ORGANISM="Thalassiosira punctigera, Strain Tpunct2005C2" /NCGR_SAMPLE_ID=MMETSP1067 /ASSEMBLY_ACC=CAM_ASM_000444 /LENGTH=388 /DNA_ID=CAMNT_0013335323 /DNA_START=164 /DNA_END=1330 /DNA_ORIENTATION=-
MKAGFGSSSLESCRDAAEAAVNAAKEGLGDSKPSIAFISTTAKRDLGAVLGSLNSFLGDTPIHGLTSSGAVLTSGGSVANGLGVLLLSSDDPEAFATAYDPEDGAAAVASLKSKMEGPQAILMSATPGAEEAIVDALRDAFPDVPVFGGTAADDDLSGQWKVMTNGKSSQKGVSLVGIGTSVQFGASMEGPYTTNEEKVVEATKTEGRRVYEIDGKPAADYFYEFLGDEVKEQYENGGLVLPQTAHKPIGIKQVVDKDFEYITAHLAAFSGSDGTYVDFFVPVPEGSKLVMMESGDGPATGYGEAMKDALQHAKSAMGEGSEPKAGLMVFCGGMAIAVGDKLDSGIATVAPGVEFPLMGMTCFGEQGPLPVSRKNVQRNLSTGFVLFG